jgi:hypothetical protein
MTHLWHRVFSSLTKGVDFHRVIINAFVLASVATLVTIPYVHYLIKTVDRGNLSGSIPVSPNFIIFQILMLFAISLLSAIVGITFGRRYALPGFGIFRNYIQDLPKLIAAGSGLMIISFVFFDRYFFNLSPGSYPKEYFYLMAIPFKGAVAEELILRFGLVTIGVGICKNRFAGVALVSVFATLLSIRYFTFIGMDVAFSYIFVAQVVLTFLINGFLGYLFVTRGLAYAMTIKFVLGFKYLMVALVLG